MFKFTRFTVAALSLGVAAFGASSAAYAQGQGKKIGLAVANLQAEFFNMIKQSVEAYGKEKGYTIITVDAKGDATTQVNQIQDLLTQNIDALIYIPAGAAAATVPVKLAKAAGVPIVLMYANSKTKQGGIFGKIYPTELDYDLALMKKLYKENVGLDIIIPEPKNQA